MSLHDFRQEIRKLLKSVDVEIGGKRPWNIQILSDKAYDRVLRDGTLGFGEAYMNGEWECQKIDERLSTILLYLG